MTATRVLYTVAAAIVGSILATPAVALDGEPSAGERENLDEARVGARLPRPFGLESELRRARPVTS